MLGEESYKKWTGVFNPGSYYKGNWEEGSKILFLGPNPETGEEGGIASMIEVCRPHEFVSIKHLNEVKDGAEVEGSAITGAWAGAHENYTFEDKDGGTQLTVDQDVTEKEAEFMSKAWDDGLAELKELAEKA
jgi:hypothetical protein